MAYTVKQLTVSDLNLQVLEFISQAFEFVNDTYGNRYNWETGFPLKYMVENHVFLICFKGDEPVGLMLGTLTPMVFDVHKKTLAQEVLYAKYPKATYQLLRYFIDIGHLKANSIIATIGTKTNIKPTSLEKLGFVKTDELYRMEV